MIRSIPHPLGVFTFIALASFMLFAGCAEDTSVDTLPASVYNSLYGNAANANFDDGSAGGWSMTGLWRINNFRAVSSPNSANFSQGPAPGDFNVITNPACPSTGGSCADGSLSRNVNLANITRLEFDYFLDGECFLGTTVTTCFYDALTVDVSTDGGATWTDLTGGNLVDTFDGVTEAFLPYVIDLTPYSGTTVGIRFYFESKDTAGNTDMGANIDNIEFF